MKFFILFVIAFSSCSVEVEKIDSNLAALSCINGALNSPDCTICPDGKILVAGVCTDNCTNGAINPPTCSQCPSHRTMINGTCYDNCSNGASNPPNCNQCPSGQTLVNGQCTSPCTNGATNPPTCNQCPSGQTLVNGQCVRNCTNGAINPTSCNVCNPGYSYSTQLNWCILDCKVNGYKNCNSTTASCPSGKFIKDIRFTQDHHGTNLVESTCCEIDLVCGDNLISYYFSYKGSASPKPLAGSCTSRLGLMTGSRLTQDHHGNPIPDVNCQEMQLSNTGCKVTGYTNCSSQCSLGALDAKRFIRSWSRNNETLNMIKNCCEPVIECIF